MAECLSKLDLVELNDKVIEYYKLLMSTSTGQESVYLKAKETLKALLDDAGLDAREKATILSQTIANMVNGISAQSMQAAIDMAKDNRDSGYTLAKLCADIELMQTQKDKLIADIANTEQETKTKIASGWIAQAQLYRDYGVIPDQLVYSKEVLDTTDYDTDYGTKHESIRLAQGNIYSTYANAYRQNGLVSLGYKTNGDIDTTATSSDNEGLTFWQTRVAERQKQGFDDNQRQHVANSSASMISMLLSTEASGINYTPYLNNWVEAIQYLNTTVGTVAGLIILNAVVSISKAAGITITGTTSNIVAGNGINISITDSLDPSNIAYGVAIVDIDGTWSGIIDAAGLSQLVTGTGIIKVEVLDPSGRLRTDSETITITA